MITLSNSTSPFSAYIAQPKEAARGAIIVIHEVWGLMDHIKSIADRFAELGLIAFAPNLLEELHLSSEKAQQLQQDLFNPERRNAVQPELRQLMAPIQEPEFARITTQRLQESFDYLYQLPESQQKVIVVGYCFGGTYSFNLAIAEPRLKLALPFYGHADQSVEELAKISCPIRAFYGEKDERLITQLPDLKNRMQEAKVDFEATVYPECGHAFFNDSNPYAYNEAAAKTAWQQVQVELAKVL